jgi:branched-chain amino acid transport system substrate-binding protein
VFDDAGDPTQAVSKVQTLISQGGVQVVQAGTISAEIAATVPVLTQAKIFTVDHGIDPTLNNTSKYPYAYSDGYLPDAPSVALAAEFAKLGYKKVGLVTDTTAGGIAAIASDKTAFSAKGISLVTAQVPAGAVTATSQFEQVLAEKPDVLLLDSYGAAAAPIMKTRAELMPKIPTFGGQLLAANDLGSIAPASAYKGMKILSIAVAVKGSAQTQTPAFKKFFAALLKVTGGKIIFTMNTYVVAYDDIIVAATAAKLAKSTSAQAMSNAMNHVTAAQMPDYVGPISFTTTNHFPLFGPSYWTFFSYGPIVDGQFVSSGS